MDINSLERQLKFEYKKHLYTGVITTLVCFHFGLFFFLDQHVEFLQKHEAIRINYLAYGFFGILITSLFVVKRKLRKQFPEFYKR